MSIISLENCRQRQIQLYGHSEDRLTYSLIRQQMFFGHVIEEVGEARKYIPRREWRKNEPAFTDNETLRKEFLYELVDIHLFIENYFLHAKSKLDYDFDNLYLETPLSELPNPDFEMICLGFNLLVSSLIPTKEDDMSQLVVVSGLFACILTSASISGTEFLEAYKEKVAYNYVRPDHK